jgi:hypothetical protein
MDIMQLLGMAGQNPLLSGGKPMPHAGGVAMGGGAQNVPGIPSMPEGFGGQFAKVGGRDYNSPRRSAMTQHMGGQGVPMDGLKQNMPDTGNPFLSAMGAGAMGLASGIAAGQGDAPRMAPAPGVRAMQAPQMPNKLAQMQALQSQNPFLRGRM